MLRLVPDGDDADRRAGEALQDIIAPMLEDLTARRLRRHQRAEADLRACIEVTGAQHLDDDERVLLELERSIDPTGAVARTAPAGVLLLVLPSFLEDPRWDGEDDIDRKARIDLMLSIARWCVRLPELRDVDTDDAMEDVLDAWRVAHRRLRFDKARRARERMDPAFRAMLDDVMVRSGIPRPYYGP
ncbi:hypothetical protein [Amnibacterium sp.]|uniref:hypothetical protein n=1 Tax=Amnibacterium sp. TaxID=1872496 RepID=UPI003F7C02D3